jgi:hypothetical protein
MPRFAEQALETFLSRFPLSLSFWLVGSFWPTLPPLLLLLLLLLLLWVTLGVYRLGRARPKRRPW